MSPRTSPAAASSSFPVPDTTRSSLRVRHWAGKRTPSSASMRQASTGSGFTSAPRAWPQRSSPSTSSSGAGRQREGIRRLLDVESRLLPGEDPAGERANAEAAHADQLLRDARGGGLVGAGAINDHLRVE